MTRTDLDISYITSKILVMPHPSEGFESAYKTNYIEDVRIFLDSRYPNSKYSIYNLSRRTYQGKFGEARIVDCSFAYPEHHRAPLLNSLYQLCVDLYQYLSGDSRHVVVIHCTVSTDLIFLSVKQISCWLYNIYSYLYWRQYIVDKSLFYLYPSSLYITYCCFWD